MSSTPLATYLATPATGAAATTALALVQGLVPESTPDSSTPPLQNYSPAALADLVTLSNTQAKYDPCLWPQPSVGTPQGINTGALISLNAQAIKDLASKLPITFSLTTNSSGVATASLSSYSLANSPIVQLTVLNPASNVTPIVADITAVSNSSLSILTQEALSTTTPVACTVHVTLYPQ